MARKEGRHLEWKQHPPVGPGVGNGLKYRMVKAALSFANWEGGFILFGVSPDGTWSGINEAEVAEIDPATLYELINGCVFPELPNLHYVDFRSGGKFFGLLHVPPSQSAPHITTKDVVEKLIDGKLRTVLARHALYCRQGAKSDLATPMQHHQILQRRTEAVRDELLRRVKEVPVAIPTPGGRLPGGSSPASLVVARLTKDGSAPAFRVTRAKDSSAGILVHEELSDGLFDEINNVVDANALLARGGSQFLLGDSIYYRIYAERGHVESLPERFRLLARTGLHDFYAPHLFWLLGLPPTEAAAVLVEAATELKDPQVYSLIRLATLLGPRGSSWLWKFFEKAYSRMSQPPDHYFTFKDMRKLKVADARLAALRLTGKATIDITGQPPLSVEKLLGAPTEASAALSKTCMIVFENRKRADARQAARLLDVLAYGNEFSAMAQEILDALSA